MCKIHTYIHTYDAGRYFPLPEEVKIRNTRKKVKVSGVQLFTYLATCLLTVLNPYSEGREGENE
jgi:hypothetical protein